MTGEEQSGLLSGASVDEIIGRPPRAGSHVLHVVEDHSGPPDPPRSGRWSRCPLHASTRDLAPLHSALATVLEAGIPLVRGLRGLAADSSGKTVARAAADVGLRIERGESLSDAMAAPLEVFNKMYVSMIRAGERVGTLDAILEDLAVYLGEDGRHQDEGAIGLVLSGVHPDLRPGRDGALLLFKIVPTFVQIYKDLGQKLPSLTVVMPVRPIS